ncbi:MAG TPA: GreA/GreB family elongation factor, partial [Bacteroidia bacterium]|nr:GreA/GreB family elongation factor [Bacteroidia bacterium]
MGKLIVNRLDYARIKKCIKDAKQFKSITATEAAKLVNELDSAKIVEPKAIPADVVTMNSIVKLSFLNTNKKIQFQIVYPDKAEIKENKIS